MELRIKFVPYLENGKSCSITIFVAVAMQLSWTLIFILFYYVAGNKRGTLKVYPSNFLHFYSFMIVLLYNNHFENEQ